MENRYKQPKGIGKASLYLLFIIYALIGATFSVSAAPADTACAGQENWPDKALQASDALRVDTSQFISEEQLERWAYELDAVGLRATGNAAHEAYIDRLAERLVCAGVNDIWFEPVPFTRWDATHWALAIVNGEEAEPVRVASYAPYTGSTDSAGLSASMVYVGENEAITAERVAGKIVLFDVPRVGYPVWVFALLSMGIYDLAHLNLFEYYTRPYLAIEPLIEILDELDAAGAAGGVAILPTAYETAYGSYFPYDGKIRSVPTLFVAKDEGAQLKALAAAETQLQLTLEAEIEETTTRNLFAIIPGASNELTVINSHTDGTNAIEDNGPDAIIGMAQYLTRLPQSALPRSVMIMLSAAHFAHGISVREFLKNHDDDGLLDRISAVVTVEHLGAQKWNVNKQGQLVNTGKPEVGVFFQPTIKALADLSFDAIRNAAAGPSAVLRPMNPDADGLTAAVWPGEGQYFWSQGGIPTANYITGPNYLLNWGISTADKIDYDRMHRQMIAFTQMQINMGLVPKEDFRKMYTLLLTQGTGLPRITWDD